MKLGEYLENLQELVRDQPKLINVEVVYSIDDEGNDYNVVNWGPTPGNYYELRRDFISEDDISKDNSNLPINAVLIN